MKEVHSFLLDLPILSLNLLILSLIVLSFLLDQTLQTLWIVIDPYKPFMKLPWLETGHL